MYTERTRSSLSRGYTRLQSLPVEQAHLGSLVLEGVRHLMQAGFPAGLSNDSGSPEFPFTKHFLDELASLPSEDEGHWLSLFEDLALIFRVHALASPDATKPEIERRILEEFESCGMWEEEHLVWQWYWKILPERCAVSA